MRHAAAAVVALASAATFAKAAPDRDRGGGGGDDAGFFAEGFLDPLPDPENITGSAPRARGRCPLFGPGCLWHPRRNPRNEHEALFRLWRKHFSGSTSYAEQLRFFEALLKFRYFVLAEHLDPEFGGYLPMRAWEATRTWPATGRSAVDGPPEEWLRRHRDVYRFFRRVCLPSVLLLVWAIGKGSHPEQQFFTENLSPFIACLMPGGYCGSDTQLATGMFRVFGFTPQQLGYLFFASVPASRPALEPMFARRAMQLREPPRGKPRRPKRRREPLTVIDVGVGIGIDSYYYVTQGFQVVAVDGNSVSLRDVHRGLRGSVENSTLLLLRAVLMADKEFLIGASAGSVEAPFWSMTGPEIREESVRIEAEQGTLVMSSGEPISGKVDRVRATTCGGLIRTLGVPHYLKVDIEDDTVHCVISLGRALASLRRERQEVVGDPGPPISPPAYISIECRGVPQWHLAKLAELGYKCFKFVRQDVYLPSTQMRRHQRGPSEAGGAAGRNAVGVGAGSGPFGEDAVDAMYGLRWRSADALVASWPSAAAMLNQLPDLYFDLHAKWDCEPS